MKEGRTYKKFGEVATFSRGLTFAKGDVADVSSKKVLRSNNIDLISHSLNFDDVACLNENFVIPDEKKLHKGDIFICMSNGSTQHLGKVAFIEDDIDYAFGGFMGAIHPMPQVIYPKYAFYSCLSTEYRRFLASILNGININNLKWSDLSKFSIPVPSIETQSQIANELDLLQSIIDKQKTQIKELDNLAQAVFYDMFGNPVENEKGWGKSVVGENFLFIKNGANIKQSKGAKGLPITRIETLSGGVFNRDRLGYADVYDEKKYEKYILDNNDILMSHINSKAYIGRSVVYKKNKGEIIIHGMNLLRLKPIDSRLDSVYAKFFFDTFFFKKQVASIRKDAVNQSSIAVGDIVKLIMLLPPLDLQQTFATKIESIEQQKDTIVKSIAETQKLFDYTMDKYFC